MRIKISSTIAFGYFCRINSPTATYLGDVKDQEELKQKLKQQKSLEKQTVKKVQKHFKSEHIKPLEWQNKPTKAIELKTNKIFSNKQEEKVVEDISDKKNYDMLRTL